MGREQGSSVSGTRDNLNNSGRESGLQTELCQQNTLISMNICPVHEIVGWGTYTERSLLRCLETVNMGPLQVLTSVSHLQNHRVSGATRRRDLVAELSCTSASHHPELGQLTSNVRKFHGIIAATTPYGCRIIMLR